MPESPMLGPWCSQIPLTFNHLQVFLEYGAGRPREVPSELQDVPSRIHGAFEARPAIQAPRQPDPAEGASRPQERRLRHQGVDA